MFALDSPNGAVGDDPVEESAFKSDIVADFFAFEPFVAENLISFG